MSAISLPTRKITAKELEFLAVIGVIIIGYLIYRKLSTAVPRAIAEGKAGLKNIVGTNDNVAQIVKTWATYPSKNPFNPKYLTSNPAKSYLKGADAQRIAKAIESNISDGKEVFRLISMAKNKAQVSQLAKSYQDQFKRPLYKDIADNLNKYNALQELISRGVKMATNEPFILKVQYFHFIVNYVNSLPS